MRFLTDHKLSLLLPRRLSKCFCTCVFAVSIAALGPVFCAHAQIIDLGEHKDVVEQHKKRLVISAYPTLNTKEQPTSVSAATDTNGNAGESEDTPESFSFGQGGDMPDILIPQGDYDGAEDKTADQYSPAFGGYFRGETAYLVDKDSLADVTIHGELRPEVTWKFNDRWDGKVSAGIDYYSEIGDSDFSEADLTYHENYIRYGNETLKLTAGAQKIIWGRVDGPKPTDQIGSLDLRTLADDYDEQRLAIPALRGEYFSGDYKIDGVFIPRLRESLLPERDSLWSLIDQGGGRVIGVTNNPGLETIVRNATFEEETGGVGGGGVRVSKVGERADYAVTVQRVKRSLPFYALHPDVVEAIRNQSALPASLDGATLTIEHPWVSVVGGDVVVPVDDTILRAEGAYVFDTPVYKSAFESAKSDQILLVAGAEFYPFDDNLRIILQGSAQILVNTEDVVSRNEIYTFVGSVEDEFDNGRWIADFDFLIGLDEYEVSLNPKLTYAGIDGHKLYLEGYYFDGSAATMGGFFKNDSHVLAGWQHEF